MVWISPKAFAYEVIKLSSGPMGGILSGDVRLAYELKRATDAGALTPGAIVMDFLNYSDMVKDGKYGNLSTRNTRREFINEQYVKARQGRCFFLTASNKGGASYYDVFKQEFADMVLNSTEDSPLADGNYFGHAQDRTISECLTRYREACKMADQRGVRGDNHERYWTERLQTALDIDVDRKVPAESIEYQPDHRRYVNPVGELHEPQYLDYAPKPRHPRIDKHIAQQIADRFNPHTNPITEAQGGQPMSRNITRPTIVTTVSLQLPDHGNRGITLADLKLLITEVERVGGTDDSTVTPSERLDRWNVALQVVANTEVTEQLTDDAKIELLTELSADSTSRERKAEIKKSLGI